MDKKSLRLLVALGLSCYFGDCAQAGGTSGITTNDIDAVFHVGDTPQQFKMRAEVLGLCERISSSDRTAETRAAGMYLISSLVEFPVTTNTPFATSSLREKSLAISDVMSGLKWIMDVPEIHRILSRTTMVRECQTNHFPVLLREARERDLALGRKASTHGQRVAFTGSLPPNVAAARREIKRVERWNSAVREYHENILQAAVQTLMFLWEDLPEETRTKRVLKELERYGMDELP